MRTALVTGGSRGIGEAVVRALCAEGWRVAFLYEKSDPAQLTNETGAIPLRCDVSDPARVNEAVVQALQSLAHIDALVNNAGIAQQKLITEVTDEEWRRMIGVNLSGAFYTMRAVLPGMISRGCGRIVNIGSVWGQVGASCEAHYSAAKAGLIGLTKAVAKEVGPSGICVNCVCPGVIETDMLRCFSPNDKAALREETPLGRLGTPEDVAGCVKWLLSDGAGFITGQIIGVGGGFGE